MRIMNVKIKQNKNTPAVRVASAALAVFVLLFSLCVPSFAYSDTSINNIDFTDQPIPSISTLDNIRSMGLKYGSIASGDSYVATTSSSDVYFFVYRNGGTAYYPCAVSQSNLASNSTAINLYPYASNQYLTWRQDNSTGLYYGNINSGTTMTSVLVPAFNSLSAGLSAVLDWINNPPVVVTPHPVSLSIPAGNALYIDVTGVSTVRASLSMTSEVAHPQSWVSNQYYGFTSSYPSSIAGNPSGSIPIPWSGFGDKTILNRYKSFSWSITSVGNSNYLFIVNPYATIDEYDQSFNPTIYITVQEAVGYKFYQLTGGIGSDGTIGQQSDGTTASGVYDPDTDSWTTTNDETGLPWTPQEGGGNIITENSINSWLQQISTQIGNFFSGAIGAVTTLVSAGSDFIQSLSGLYAWLPSPVYAVLTSALILVITIGVIKVFI